MNPKAPTPQLALAIMATLLTFSTALCQKPEIALQSGHNRVINWMEYTPDGQYLITSDSNEIRAWETEGYKLLSLKRVINPYWEEKQSPRQLVTGNYGLIPPYAFDTGSRRRYYTSYIHSIDYLAASQSLVYQVYNQIYAWPLDQYAGKSQLHSYKKGLGPVSVSPEGTIYAYSEKDFILIRKASGRKAAKKIKHNLKDVVLEISPGGQFIIARGANGKARAWVIQSGKKLNAPFLEGQKVGNVAFGADGSRIFTLSDGAWACFSFPQGQKLYSIQNDGPKLAVSPDGKAVYISKGRTLSAYQAADGAPMGAPRVFSGAIRTFALHPQKPEITIGFEDKGHQVYHLPDFNLLHEERNRKNTAEAVAFSPDERYLASSHSDQTIKVWDIEQGKLARVLVAPDGVARDIVFSPAGHKLIAGAGPGSIHVWDVASGKLDTTLKAHTHPVLQLGFDTTGHRLLSLDSTKTIIWDFDRLAPEQETKTRSEFRFFGLRRQKNSLILMESVGKDRYNEKMAYNEWGLDSGEKLDEGSLDFMSLEKASISSDGRYLVMASAEVALKRARVVVWDLVEKKPIITLFNLDAVESLIFSPDGRKLFVAGSDHSFEMFDWEQIKGLDPHEHHFPIHELADFNGHYESIRSAAFSPTGDYFVSAANDQQLIIWDLEKKCASLVLSTFDDQEAWIVKDSIGRFDGNQQAFNHLHYVVDNEAISFSQLKERYYQPKLLAIALQKSGQQSLNSAMLKDVPLYPGISLFLEGDTLQVQLTPRSGGIGKVGVFIGNKEVVPDANPQRAKAFSVNLSEYRKYFGPGQACLIGVQAWNEEQWLSSKMQTISYTPTFAIQLNAPAPRAHIICIGASDYKGEAVDLRYADKDARLVAQALATAARELLGPGQADTYLFTSSPDSGDLGSAYTSKANILGLFQQLSQTASPEDVLILYLSGHGTTYQAAGKEQFYYLTPELGGLDIRDNYLRETYAISTEEFAAWLNSIPCRKAVLIMDACASGAFNQGLGEELLAARGSTPSQIRAVDRLKDRAGVFVISGSTADKSSFEASQFGQGLLTYSLLLGIKGGEGLRNREFIDVLTLFNFAKEKVPVLAAQIGGIQDPMIFAPLESESYDIGQATELIRQSIPIAQPKPFFTRARFIQNGTAFDELGLEERVNTQLEEYSQLGPDAPLIFIDEGHNVASFQIGGLYEVDGEQLTVTCTLRYNKQPHGQAFTVTGPMADLAGVAKLIVQKAYREVE
ncbi:MAG: caspase family protein [Lewinellaceae bacterium]|nr:caspase family protein [Lewinellaceae bacterium]